ncbi:MAG: bis(5'-nucleosyl)-tetraphosphatase [Planctomycetota bacterium]
MTSYASGILLYRLQRQSAPDGAVSLRPALLLLRSADTGNWGFAKGRRDPEDAHEVATALREVREETGYTGLTLQPCFRAELHYLVRDPDGDYPKQVVYFLAEAPAGEPVLSHEHDAALWTELSEALQRLAFDQLRDLVRLAFRTLESVATQPGATREHSPRGS